MNQNRLPSPRSLAVLLVFSLTFLTAHGAEAQQVDPATGQAAGLPAAGPVVGLPMADPTAGAPAGEEPKSWLMRTPLVDVPWPEFRMPKLSWKPIGGAPSDQSKPGPLGRMTAATQNAAQRTRTAWNATIDKMKVGPFRSQQPDAQPGFFARWFGGEDEPERSETVAEFIGQDRPDFR